MHKSDEVGPILLQLPLAKHLHEREKLHAGVVDGLSGGKADEHDDATQASMCKCKRSESSRN